MGIQKDGGTHAWLCVAVVFINYMLMVGVSKCFSLVYMLALERFGGTATATAWVGSLQVVLRLGLGPIVSVLLNRFGIRPVVVIGALGQAVAYILSGLAPSLFTFTLSFGVLMGICASFVYVPSQFILAYYFDKRKALAYSIACSGMGVGIFLLPPFYYYVEQGYGFSGAMLIMGGLMLNLLASGILFKVPKVDNSVSSGDGGEEGKLTETKCGCADATDNTKENEEPASEKSVIMAEAGKDTIKDIDVADRPLMQDFTDIFNQDSSNKEQITSNGNNITNSNSQSTMIDNIKFVTNGNIQPFRKQEKKQDNIQKAVNGMKNGILSKGENVQAVPSRNSQFNNKCPSITTRQGTQKKKIFNLTLLSNKAFLALLLWTAAITLACSVHSTFSVALMVNHGISQDHSAILISITGITDIVGNLVTGGIYDLKPVQKHKMLYYAFFMMVLGAVVTFMPMVSSFTAQTVLFALYGFSAAPVCTLRVPLISEAIGKENLPNAVGMMLITHGSGYVVGPFLGGVIADSIGSYSLPFYLSGSILCLCAVLCSVKHVLLYRKIKRVIK